MIERIITLEYALYEGDVRPATTGRYHMPMGTMFVGLLETLHINWVSGQWEVTNPKNDPDRHWVGHADFQQMAILDYLRARLGMPGRDPTQLAEKVIAIAEDALTTGRTHSTEDQLGYSREALTEIIETCKAPKPEPGE